SAEQTTERARTSAGDLSSATASGKGVVSYSGTKGEVELVCASLLRMRASTAKLRNTIRSNRKQATCALSAAASRRTTAPSDDAGVASPTDVGRGVVQATCYARTARRES